MSDTFYRKMYKKVTPETPIEEKEQIIYTELMKTDRVFVRNMREGDLFYSFGGEVANKFIQKIQTQEMTVGRQLNAIEIENTYQEMIGSLEKWKL